VDGARGRGRPRTSRLENIVRWTGRMAIELHCASQDRRKWRKITGIVHLKVFKSNFGIQKYSNPISNLDKESVIGGKAIQYSVHILPK